ncbi:MAG: threonine synthase [Abditibacteriota bacterium]|nr:threonine synthase [Abditibacteriota bacterium]MBP5738035.1 threonine synthase [Abditibacteriota bacterium]
MSRFKRMPLIERYREYLPMDENTPVVSLYEGYTPLVKLPRLSAKISDKLTVYVKFEGMNPTGSFKDRGMTMAISKAVEAGSKATICASTGNTAASAAAYSARAGLVCAVILPKGEVALGKVSQSMMHGAKVIAIDGNFDDALNIVKGITENYPITLVNSLNPFRIEGQKTGAFEICDDLGHAPVYHAIPVGNAGNITAYWAGYKAYKEAGKIDALPKMLGFQAAGSAPIVEGHPIEFPETIATAIRIGNPASWKRAEAARDESGGLIEKVTDEEITEAQKLLAATEGVFCEPASAASVAGVIKKAKEGFFTEKSDVVCILTGHGLKDPQRAIKICDPFIELPNSIDAVAEEMGLK